MEGLSIAVLRFHFKALEEIYIPAFKGSAFRGGFGSVFKKAVCINRGMDCNGCLLKFKCAYSYVFETPAKGNEGFRTSHLPHPYVLEPPLERKTHYLPGQTFSANLILFGKGIDYLPYFILVMEEFGRNGIGKGRGKFVLQSAESLAHPGDQQGKLLFESERRVLQDDGLQQRAFELAWGNSLSDDRILRVDFITPTRITSRNRLTDPALFSFEIFIRSLIRRAKRLAFDAGLPLEFDEGGIIERARKVRTIANHLSWDDWERYSTRQEEHMKLGGFKGQIAFKGPIGPFLPLLKLGEYTHVGKATSFGDGKYLILDEG